MTDKPEPPAEDDAGLREFLSIRLTGPSLFTLAENADPSLYAGLRPRDHVDMEIAALDAAEHFEADMRAVHKRLIED